MAGIFHAYDIRGLVDSELDEGVYYLIGRAIASHTKARKVLVGRDMRPSSIPYEAALVRGLTDQGADVVRIGLTSSSMFYWATQKYPAGVMVTASHNPAQYNGCKICGAAAVPIGEANGMRDIEALVLSQAFPNPRRKGKVSEKDVLNAYVRFCKSFLHTRKRFTVVIDAANGMGGHTHAALRRVLKTVKVIPMWFELDGNFPNHEANPLKVETLDALKRRVREEKADLGVALDGDSDRIVFVDERGDDLQSDLATALLARQVLHEHPGATILYDVRQSRVTPEEIEAAGGKPVMTRVGHAFIKLAMREHAAAFGGELSGHFYNAEQSNTENTEIVMMRMLNLLAEEGKPLSRIVAPLHRYSKIVETNYEVHDPKASVERIGGRYASMPGARVSRIDGVRVDFDDWWFNLRPSNTEPLLRLNMEARTPAMLEAAKAEIERAIEERA